MCSLVLLYIGRVLSSHPQMLHHTFGKVTCCSRVSFDAIPYFLALMSRQWMLEMPSSLVPSGQLEDNTLKASDCFDSKRVCTHVRACVHACHVISLVWNCFKNNIGGNVWEREWSACGPPYMHRYHLELNWTELYSVQLGIFLIL